MPRHRLLAVAFAALALSGTTACGMGEGAGGGDGDEPDTEQIGRVGGDDGEGGVIEDEGDGEDD